MPSPCCRRRGARRDRHRPARWRDPAPPRGSRDARRAPAPRSAPPPPRACRRSCVPRRRSRSVPSIGPLPGRASRRSHLPRSVLHSGRVIVGVPREIKAEENRVALTPSGVGALVARGHTVVVEHGAGAGSSLPDRLYRDAGATLTEAAAVWGRAELILKVKEPLPTEYDCFPPDQILFTYLHLAANPELVRVLLARRVRALAYETLQLEDGSLPLLAPMSEIAGRLAVQVGAWCLQAQNGGRGVLLSGASGVRPAEVVILGAGIAGTNACQVAVGVGDRKGTRLNSSHLVNSLAGF